MHSEVKMSLLATLKTNNFVIKQIDYKPGRWSGNDTYHKYFKRV